MAKLGEGRRLTLGDVCQKGSSNIAQKDLVDNEGKYPIYGASGFIKNVDFCHQKKSYIAVVKDGAGIGRTMLLPANSSVIGTMQYLIPKEDVDIDVTYLYYAIDSMNLAKYYSGATIPHIYYKDYQKEPINLPCLAIQREIANIFMKIDQMIEWRNQQLQKLDELVKSRFVEMFGDPKNNKSSLVKIGEIGTLSSGGTPSRTKPEYFQGTIRWYSAGELNTLFLTDSVEHISEVALQQSSAKLFHKGTLMIGMYDTAAFKMGILTEDSSSNQACANLNPKEGYNVIWLYYLFDFMKPVFLLERQGIRQKNLSLSKIREFEVPIASLDLQNQFADFVAQVDKSKFMGYNRYRIIKQPL